jgi:hypothetical protein
MNSERNADNGKDAFHCVPKTSPDTFACFISRSRWNASLPTAASNVQSSTFDVRVPPLIIATVGVSPGEYEIWVEAWWDAAAVSGNGEGDAGVWPRRGQTRRIRDSSWNIAFSGTDPGLPPQRQSEQAL